MFSLGQRVRELRLKKGITQIDLAKGICTPSMISQIESDRARPSYKILFSVADKLEVPLEKLLSEVDLNLEYVSNYKMSRAMVAAKEYGSAIPLLQELLQTPRGQIPTVDVLCQLVECYVYTGQLNKAEETIEQAREIATLRNDHHLLAELLHKNAQIEWHRKHYQLAAYQWRKALDEVDKMEQIDIHLHATILFHLGSVHKMLGSISDSITYYNQAGQLFSELGTPYDMAKVFLGLGKAYRKINDLDRATAYSEQAAAIFDSSENILTVIKTKVQTAALYVLKQRGDEALPLLEQAIQQLHDLGNCEEEGIAVVELAKLKLQNGEVNEAEDLCHRAKILLPESHLYLAWINRILGKIALHRNQRDKAVKSFHKAADCFKQLEEMAEWDDTMHEISRLHLEENDPLRACIILEEIRRYTRQVLEEKGIVL